MTEIERLILEVESKGVAGVNKDLASVKSHADGATTGFSKLTVGLKAFGLAAVGVIASLAGVANKLVEATKTYQGFNAQLKVALGSQERASAAMEALNKFAATTPYSVGEATTAFIKLINLGLNPSADALTAYGNTASSMGKSLDQMIEAVADAATGEFERLKEFGIKASQQGDKVTFTFRGVSTTVGKSAKEIEGFLMGIGN